MYTQLGVLHLGACVVRSTGQKYNDMYIYVHNTRIFMYFLLLGSEI